jgi:dUTP pyrophosphatase
MQVRIKKLTENAILPKRGSDFAAGFDLVATSREDKDVHGTVSYISYGTGLAVEIPEGFVGYIFPRSSISNKGMSIANSVGVIDADYRGEITVRMYPVTVSKEEDYNIGDRIAQLIIMPIPSVEYVETDELSKTVREAGSYGSTGVSWHKN